jgi:tRNA modification GTPase
MDADTSAFSTDDTIVAVATAAGRGAIGVVRLSGPDALRVANVVLGRRSPLEPRRATLARVVARAGQPGDEAVAVYFQAPRSYTGQDVVELSLHGSPVIMRAVVAAACAAGARLARPGEFTLRAYVNGKRDLVQAEAVADVVNAVTPLQARVAFDQLQGTLSSRITEIDQRLFDLIARLEASLDFPDEGYHFVDTSGGIDELAGVLREIEQLLADARRGRMIREGAHVVIAGRTNVGKSRLFNALSGADRAIVTDVEGTTRDLLTEVVDIVGLAVTLVDTAGTREAADTVEVEGIRRAFRARQVADLVVVVLDQSEALRAEDRAILAETADAPRIVVANKCDLPGATLGLPADETVVRVSAVTGEGLDSVRHAIASALSGATDHGEPPLLSNARHVLLMEEASEKVRTAIRAVADRLPEEFVLSDLHAASARFEEVVGRRTSSDVLSRIFERFCIGK